MTNIAIHRAAWCALGVLFFVLGCSGQVEVPPTGGGGSGGEGGSSLPPKLCGNYVDLGDCCADVQGYEAGCIWLDPMPEFPGRCVSEIDCTSSDAGCPEGQVCTVMKVKTLGECSILADQSFEQGVCIDE